MLFTARFPALNPSIFAIWFFSFSHMSQGALSFVSTIQIVAANHKSALHVSSFSGGNFAEAVNDFYINAPIQAAFVTCAVKASAADAFAQVSACLPAKTAHSKLSKQSNSKKQDVSYPKISLSTIQKIEFHVPRNVGFILYGGFYQGVVQYFIYNVFFPVWFGASTDPYTVAMKVLTDAVLLAPFINMPVSYSIKEAMYGSKNPVLDGVQRYFYDAVHKDLLFKFWAIWVPANILSFSVIPDHLRIAFVASVSFFWLILLSKVSCSESEEITEDRSAPVSLDQSNGIRVKFGIIS